MAENPLLPNAELRKLHTLLKQAVRAERSAVRKTAQSGRRRNAPSASREALLAGTLLQLRPGDTLLAESSDLFPAALLPSKAAKPLIGSPRLPPGMPQLTAAAAMAAALPTADPRPLILALLQAGTAEPQYELALAWAQEAKLSLILACADPSGAGALRSTPAPRPGSIHWAAITKTAARLKLPVLTVDGEDAVAVYRVMQESVLRARSGDGPAILWAVLPTAGEFAAKRPPSAQPQRRLERYLRTRKISL